MLFVNVLAVLVGLTVITFAVLAARRAAVGNSVESSMRRFADVTTLSRPATVPGDVGWGRRAA